MCFTSGVYFLTTRIPSDALFGVGHDCVCFYVYLFEADGRFTIAGMIDKQLKRFGGMRDTAVALGGTQRREYRALQC